MPGLRANPVWWYGVIVYVAYCAIVFGCWATFGIDYSTVATEPVIVVGVILPLGLGAVLLTGFNQAAKWWRLTLFEKRSGPAWILIVMLAVLAVFVGLHLSRADWPAITPAHLWLMVLATLLIGYCEEMLTRGVVLISLRGSLRSEVWAWFWSTALFAVLHLPNGFFGAGWAAAAQVVFAFFGGTALYVLRRTSGSLIVPMLVHAAWDFSTFASGVSGAVVTDAPMLVAQFGTYFVAIILVTVLLMRERRQETMLAPAG